MLVGDEVLAVNGEVVRDVIAYQIQVDGAHVELDLRRGGLERVVTIDKPDGAPLGVELTSAVFDRVRTCDNHCPFCFIYQLPKGMRKSLYLKDDDYRLSFLYGNFTTLTRFTEADLERVVTERLGPLYVSIHATDPDVRTRLLRNRRGATSLRWLELLLDAGIEVHGQVVVCPGVNDGAVLDDTLLGVLDRFPALATVGVVPLGVSAHNREAEMRAHTLAEAQAVVDIVERVAGALPRRARSPARVRVRRVLPPRRAAVPGARRVRRLPAARERHRHGAHVRGRGARRARGRRRRRHRPALRLLRVGRRRARRRLPRPPHRPDRVGTLDGRPTRGERCAQLDVVITGEYGRGGARAAARRAARAACGCSRCKNAFFGGNIGVTGLLTGADIAAALAGQPEHDRYLLPDVALSRGRFLDGTTAARAAARRSRSCRPTARRSCTRCAARLRSRSRSSTS